MNTLLFPHHLLSIIYNQQPKHQAPSQQPQPSSSKKNPFD
jgi:hypothetical protein